MGTSSLFQSSNPFFLSNSQSSDLQKILSQFDLISSYQDDLFKKCSVIRHKQTQELIIAKEMECKDQNEMKKYFQEFNRRKDNMQKENLIRLRYVLNKKTDGIFNDQFKIVLFFDYLLIDLHAQYINRKQKQTNFTAQQINIIMVGAIRGFAALEQLNIPNNKVRLTNIYFGLAQNSSTITKVIDSTLFADPTNLQCIRNNQQKNNVFLAPQQLPFIRQGKFKSNKEGVYSFGMCLMQLCLLEGVSSLYTYHQRFINYAQLDIRLNIIKNRYPLSVFYLIRQMLQRNEDSRMSFKQLSQKLPSNIKMLQKNINLSVMKPSFQSKYSSSSKVKSPVMQSRSITPLIIPSSQRSMHSTSLTSQYRPLKMQQQIYTNGNRYQGQKRGQQRHGKGKYIYSDNSYYYGDWIKGKMQGQGKLYDLDGNLEYQGQWKDDHFDGRGKLNDITGTQDWIRYQGEFSSGQKEGFGEMFMRDGNRYKGNFRSGLMWGQGRIINQRGDVVRAGVWNKGVFISQN